MFGAVKVLGCVLIFRGVAAAHVTAFHAQAQVDPRIAHLQALLATVLICGAELDLLQV